MCREGEPGPSRAACESCDVHQAGVFLPLWLFSWRSLGFRGVPHVLILRTLDSSRSVPFGGEFLTLPCFLHVQEIKVLISRRDTKSGFQNLCRYVIVLNKQVDFWVACTIWTQIKGRSASGTADVTDWLGGHAPRITACEDSKRTAIYGRSLFRKCSFPENNRLCTFKGIGKCVLCRD